MLREVRTWLDGRDPVEVTLRDIARALGIPPTSVYRYFESMDELRAALGGVRRRPARVPAPAQPPVPVRPQAVDRAFADSFISRAIGPEQLGSVVAKLLGESISVGPLAVGPKGRASAMAVGRFGAVSVRPGASGPVMIVTVPVFLEIDIHLGKRFRRRIGARVAIPLSIVPRIEDSLLLMIEVIRPDPVDIVLDLGVGGVSAAMLRRVGNIDGLLREQTLGMIDGILDSPAGRAATEIDHGVVIDEAWKNGLVL